MTEAHALTLEERTKPTGTLAEVVSFDSSTPYRLGRQAGKHGQVHPGTAMSRLFDRNNRSNYNAAFLAGLLDGSRDNVWMIAHGFAECADEAYLNAWSGWNTHNFRISPIIKYYIEAAEVLLELGTQYDNEVRKFKSIYRNLSLVATNRERDEEQSRRRPA